jgi:uncharacterized membrane protein
MRLNELTVDPRVIKLLCKKTLCIILLLLLGCFFLSAIIPPLTSPDEHDHIERAYLLGKGVIVLDRLAGKSSGGYVDSGLLKYLGSYLPTKDKLSADDVESAGAIRWSGDRVYDPSPGTGYYFPAIYIPQTLGLLVGERLDLSIDHSYKLARMFVLFSVTLVLYGAFRLYPPNPLVLALISIPMTLFQISSASLDGISTALAIFSTSAFLRIASDKSASPAGLLNALGLAIAVLASSRLHALPMIALPAALFFITKERRALFIFGAVASFSIGWTLFALRTIADLRFTINGSTSSIVVFYLQNPFKFFSVVWLTLSDYNLRNFYYQSFLGILGWLDAPFQDRYYTFFSAMLAVIALLSVSLKQIKDDRPQRLLLLAVSITSTLLILFALLVTCSPHPAQVISCVQGRYFLLPSIILAYGVTGSDDSIGNFRSSVASFLVLCLFLVSITSSARVIINRYYLNEFQIKSEKIILGFVGSFSPPKMISSAPLEQNAPINLRLPPLTNQELGKVVRIGIFFGTHRRKNHGEAELLLSTIDGEVYNQILSLPDLIDNHYGDFKVPANYYTSGKIRFKSGGGVSVWEVHANGRIIYSCVRLRTVRNQMITIKDCP